MSLRKAEPFPAVAAPDREDGVEDIARWRRGEEMEKVEARGGRLLLVRDKQRVTIWDSSKEFIVKPSNISVLYHTGTGLQASDTVLILVKTTALNHNFLKNYFLLRLTTI